MNQPQHTPTPLEYFFDQFNGRYVIIPITNNQDVEEIAHCFDETNARHIVHCVNLMPEMIEVVANLLSLLVNSYTENGMSRLDVQEWAYELLAKAKAGTQ